MKGKFVTEQEVKENMQDVIVRTATEFDKPVTYVTVRMKNGFTLRESTTCVDPANYDENIGKDICLEKIEDKIWFLLGYALQDKIDHEPKNYVERMEFEYSELRERIIKLGEFFNTDTYRELDETKKELLRQQFRAMHEYIAVLGKRLKLEGYEIAPLADAD